MRLASSCRQCRTAKRRCQWSANQPDCQPCQERNERCSNRKPTILPAKKDLSITEILKIVKLYFIYIHDRPHSLFHEVSLRDSITNGTADKCLVLAICAMGCRFSESAEQRAIARDLQLQAIADFSTQLETVSISNIQTCILIANLHAAEQNSMLEALYFGIANRMAHLLRLHEGDPNDDQTTAEIKRRVWCSLYMADRWCLPSLAIPRTFQNQGQTDALLDEAQFQGRTTHSFIGESIWKHKMILADVFGLIQDFNQSLVNTVLNSDEAARSVARFNDFFEIWPQQLPHYLEMNEANLLSHRDQDQGGTFVALHFGYHHYATLFYFQFLDREHESGPIQKGAERCRSHALAYSRLLHRAREMDCHVVYLTVAQMTMVSSAVLLHMLLFGAEADVEEARIQLTRNFEALIELRKYWPLVEKMTQRLLIFQSACLRFPPGVTHRIDRWMIRFLLEYSLPLEERTIEATESGISSDRTQMVDRAFEGLRW